MNRFILLGGIFIGAWFVFMAVYPFPLDSWLAFSFSCENYLQGYARFLPERGGCPDPTLESMRLIVIGVTTVLIGLAGWSFWRGTRN